MTNEGIYVCAELGVGWRGSRTLLESAIARLGDAKVRAVKLQMFDQEVLKNYPAEIKNKLEPMILDSGDIRTYAEMCVTDGIDLVVTPFSDKLMQDLVDLVSDGVPIKGIKIRHKDWRNLEMRHLAAGTGLPVYVSIPYKDKLIDQDMQLAKANMDPLRAYSSTRAKNFHRIYCVPKYPPLSGDLNVGMLDYNFDGCSLHSRVLGDHLAAAVVNTRWQWDRGTKRRFYIEVHTVPYFDMKSCPDDTLDREVSLSMADTIDLQSMCDRLEDIIG